MIDRLNGLPVGTTRARSQRSAASRSAASSSSGEKHLPGSARLLPVAHSLPSRVVRHLRPARDARPPGSQRDFVSLYAVELKGDVN